MVLNLEASAIAVSKLSTEVNRMQSKLSLIKQMLMDDEMTKDSPEEKAIMIELLKADEGLGDIWFPLYKLTNALQAAAKTRQEGIQAELAKLKQEAEEQRQKVKNLFHLDEENCELKRKLRELTGEIDSSKDRLASGTA